MGRIIGPSQSAFIAGRNILDGVAILTEIIDEAKVNRNKRLIFKVDFAKAYDSIDWAFLDEMMERMNFPDKWRAWVREGLTTATANVLVNGSPSGQFHLERGVRQGDPFSPFLFLIVAEGLNLLIERAVRGGLLGAVEVGREKNKVSHIQYADDTLFVVEGTLANAQVIKGILKNFELLSGLEVNFNKCRVFGLNLGEEEVAGMATVLGCQVGCLPITYLGMKVGGDAKKIAHWGDVVDKVKKRLLSWGSRKVSLGGRITLTNAVLGAIPIYRMSYMKAPVAATKTITALQRNFLWSGECSGRGRLAWIKWEHLCKSKKEGGLGFKFPKWFNLALLGKWLWRFLTERDSLWVKVVRSRHGGLSLQREGLVMVDDRRANRKGWWSRMVAIGEGEEGKWLWDNISKSIGNGMSTRFWTDKWVGTEPLKEIFPRLFQLCTNKDILVGEAGRWDEGRWVWEIGWRRGLLEREKPMEADLRQKLEGVELCRDKEDTWRWKGDDSRKYTVKEAYEEIAKSSEEPENRNRLKGCFTLAWKASAPFKSQALVWRLIWDRIPTRDNLIKRRVLHAGEGSCTGCTEGSETAAHVFLGCTGINELWRRLLIWVGVSWVMPNTIPLHFMSFARCLGGGKRRRVFGGLWICIISVIWRWRNLVIFENGSWDYRKIEEEVKSRFWGWCVAKGIPGMDRNFLAWTSTPLAVRWKDL